jgi:primosomal protein N' (replication factor Y)
MERRAGRYRAHLLVQSDGRRALQAFLERWVPELHRLPGARGVRWSLDVDPQELL